MSNRTYVCTHCGALRRRPAVYFGSDGRPTSPEPICHDTPMRALVKGYAEAATKLSPCERVGWLAAGGQIVRRPGGKWKAALSEREFAESREQLARQRGSDPPAS